ncbi:hypothetical protein SLG_13040 [Sphingobium sp. SYK-6]|uniref:hypothetical protein n=1 Tax=Sphingobium sp. (strain NBRC 103272 / SYK-6) TaxID=627192 RepID=UPI0002277398|nr:hypothetical protein [Sphingobium sp. SYK-6]BAK65979.1 hypothetical protein SLG_13040 [Sphingobium sp. SYK-6]
MSLALIDDLSVAASQLRDAMQRADLGDIEKGLDGFRSSIEAVQANGAWRSEPQIKAKIAELMTELDASRGLALLLGDMAGQAHAAAAARTPDAPQPLYRR